MCVCDIFLYPGICITVLVAVWAAVLASLSLFIYI